MPATENVALTLRAVVVMNVRRLGRFPIAFKGKRLKPKDVILLTRSRGTAKVRATLSICVDVTAVKTLGVYTKRCFDVTKKPRSWV